MKNKDIGFVLIKMFNNQIYDDILTAIQSCIYDNPSNQIVIFNSYSEKINTFNIPILHLSQAKFFYGDLFIFDMVSLLLTKSFPNVATKYLYAQDIPWTISKETNYFDWHKLLNNESLQIIAKNEEIDQIYSKCWKKPLCVTERFDYEKLKHSL